MGFNNRVTIDLVRGKIPLSNFSVKAWMSLIEALFS